MRIKLLLFTAFVALLALSSQAQDLHFTQYNMSPMTLNPANIGAFEGTVRIGGIYRSQWTSVLKSNQFETPSIWVDAPIIRGFRRQDWIGVGVVVVRDKVGIGPLRHNVGKLGASYHLGFGKGNRTVLTLGAHYGSEAYSIDGTELQFDSGWRQSISDPTIREIYNAMDAANTAYGDENNPARTNVSDIDAGITLRTKLNKTMDMTLGFAMFHVGRPRFTLGTPPASNPNPNPNPTPASNFRLPSRSVIHGNFNIKTNDRITISPSFIYQTRAKQDEIMVQGLAHYLFNPEKDITLNAGLGYRLGDAVNLLVGAKVKDLRVGLAYDVNTSSLSNDTRNRGGFEIAANYIIKIYKKSTVKPKVLCPRF
jgi:type IX secretion system PorP/SprF family membrane protein